MFVYDFSAEKIGSVCFITVVPISGDFFRRLSRRENISVLEPSNAINHGFEVILLRGRDNISIITRVTVWVDSLRKCALVSVLLYRYGNIKPLHFSSLSALPSSDRVGRFTVTALLDRFGFEFIVNFQDH